jgi:regulator of replication initiation timing
MVDQTRWGIPDIITQNKARAKEKKDFQDKIEGLKKDIDRLSEENANVKLINKNLNQSNKDLVKKLDEQVKEFRNKGDL